MRGETSAASRLVDASVNNAFPSDAAEREGGTQQPASVCDVEYYGLTSPVEGSVVHPEPHRLFAMEGPVKCRQHFIPAPNQSVVITVSSRPTECLISAVHLIGCARAD